MEQLIHCSRCKMTVQTECTEEDHTTCSLFKSAEARKAQNSKLEVLGSEKLVAKIDEENLVKEIYSAAQWWSQCQASKSSDGAIKYDEGKVPLDLLAPEFLIATATILQFGAKKYEAYNWAKGMKWSRVFAALMRHLWKWWGGEKLDPDTGLSHLWHASCGLMFLIVYEERGTGDDDRPTEL